MFCTNCGKQLQDTLKFCTGCGTPILSQNENNNLCANCGKELQNTQNFCTACGTPRQQVQHDRQNLPALISPQTERPQGTQEQMPFQQQININVHQQEANKASNIRMRHGFTSFCLWYGFISSILVIPIVLFLLLVYDELVADIIGYFYPSLSSKSWLYWIMVYSAATIFGFWDILKNWKRRGFYFLIFANVVIFFVALVYIPSEVVSAIIQCSIYLLLTFLVLKIRNNYNAKSTWEQLG